tara:strand:+ start:3409 stop:6018 length:2610 start_codon:yes stop_codon:yes gene_type:complete
MKVTVKKSVLFNLLKKHLQENRTAHNPSGNFISVIEKEPGPFGFEEEEAPIQPSAHMAVQLSVEEPPVDQEDYVPATHKELQSAAAVISREVPQSQINYFYRKLHQLLDSSLDRDDGGMNFLSEGIDLLHESETLADKLIQDAGRKVAEEFADSSELAIELINNYSEFEDMDEFDLAQKIDNASLSRQGVDIQTQAPEPTPQRTSRAGKTIIRRKKSNPEEPSLPLMPSNTQEDEVEDNPNYQKAANKQEYLIGYDAGLDTDAGIQINMPSNPSPDFNAGYNDALEQAGRGLSVQQPTMPQETPPRDLVVQLVLKTHNLLFDISRRVEKEYFQANFTKDGRDLSSYDAQSLNPSTKKYGIRNDYVFTALNLSKKAAGNYFFTKKKIKDEVSKFVANYIVLNENPEYTALLQKAAARENLTKDQMINLLSNILSEKYDQERGAIDSAEQDMSGDEFLDKNIRVVFSKVTKKEPYKYINVSRHFMNRATRDQQQPIIDDILTAYANKRKGDVYKIKGREFPASDFEDYVSNYVSAMIDQAETYQQNKTSGDDDLEDESVDLTDEEKAARDFAKKIARLSTTTNFDNLAPFFGFSSASGLRQWYLKHAFRKLKALNVGVKDGNKNGFAKLYEETFEAIAPMLKTAIDEKIADLEGRLASDNNEILQQQLVILQAASPQLDRIVQLIDNDTFYNSNDAGKSEGMDLLYTVGGYLLRTVNSEIYKPIMNLIDKNWTDFMAEIIESKSTANAKQAKSAAEYFTGKKEVPNYEAMTKAAKNLLKINIGYDEFSELIKISNEWFEDTIETEFSRLDTADGTVRGEFLEAILKTISKLSKDSKRMNKSLDSAVASYLEDLAHQIAFKNLSDYETESGD